jgi:hypothetical protein
MIGQSKDGRMDSEVKRIRRVGFGFSFLCKKVVLQMNKLP